MSLDLFSVESRLLFFFFFSVLFAGLKLGDCLSCFLLFFFSQRKKRSEVNWL